MKTVKLTFIYLASLLLAGSCRHKEAGAVAVISRDTTITPEYRVTSLVLDSLAVADYLQASEIPDSTRAHITNFYNKRNYQYGWFNEDGLAEHARTFWNLHNEYIDLNRDSSLYGAGLHAQMESLINEDTLFRYDSDTIRNMELMLTRHFFEYSERAYQGRISPSTLQWHIPAKKVNALDLLDSLVAGNGNNINEWEPVNPRYRWTKNKLKDYYQIKKWGGWKSLSMEGKNSYRKGDVASVISGIKRRLYLSGDFSSKDTSSHFTEELQSAVISAQSRFGLERDGVVGRATMDALNIPVEQRIRQLLINMERMRWLPEKPEGTHIVANIPEFRIHVYDGNNEVFSMAIVVGTAANKTVIFSDELKYVVFSPYWNVPRSIVRNEILPAMNRSPRYLQRNNMEQTGISKGLPVIRQKPGPRNALGRVKFIFPNSYNIYFHDTPAKGLFERQQRAFSHGCIRLEDPFKMAQYLLRDKDEWTDARIRKAMRAGVEKWVTLDQSIPVFITYFTAWVDAKGAVHFRDDIYGKDAMMEEHLFSDQ